MRAILAFVVLTAATGVAFAEGGPELKLSDFTSDADLAKWTTGDSGTVELSVEPPTPTDPNNMLKVVFKGGQWPGFSTTPPRDWSAYEALRFVVWTPTAVGLNIRIDDVNSSNYETRYNRTFKLEPGRNLCQIEVSDIARKFDVKRIRSLILFTSKPPSGLTMHFDDFVLGPLLTEKVPFIPYEERKDLQPTLDFVTPHLPFGRGLAGGPVKAFVMSGITYGREVPEMMQRMDLDVSLLTWDRNWDVNTWGMGDFYSQRGHAFDYVLMQRYLASSLQGPEEFDVLVLPTPQGWDRFPQGAREAIADRVRNGAGLVLVLPFPGGAQGQEWPEDLKELSALVDSETDYPDPARGYIRAGGGIIRGKTWRNAAAHPITKGVPFDAIPMASIQIQKYAAAPGARVIIETEDGAPVLAVKSLGKGRVATFAWRSPALTPEMPGGPAYRYWEPVYSLMNRAVAWAAGRDFTRQGRPQVVETPEAHRDPSLSARVWRNPAGEVTDWELVFVPPGAGPVASIEIDAPRNVLRGEDIIVSFAVPADADEVRAELIERVEGSVRTVETHRRCPVKLVSEGDRRVYEATLPSSRIRQTMAFARVTAMKSGAVAALGEAEVVVAPRYAEGENRWQDYEVLMWPVDSLPFLQDYDDRLIREMGCTGVMTTRWNSASNRMRWARAGLRMMPHEIRGSSLHFRNWSEIVANWNTSRDRKWLVRNPSFADKDFLARERRIVADAVKAIAPFNPTNYVLADEPSITSYTADFDYDFHPANIEWFRRELEARFGTVENMNAALGTSAGSFDAVEPPITEDARKAGQWGLWNEWRRHNDFVMAEGYRMYLDEVRKADPNGTISVSGTQTATAFDGFDWGRLSPLFGTMQGYGYGYQDNKRMSFNPDMLNATPAGYGRSGRAVHHQVWSKLADHGAGHVIFWWIAFRNPDFTFCNSAKDYQEAFSEMRRGIGRQFMQARRRMSPVAVIYSMNSMRAAYAEGKMQNRSGEFPSTESSVSGAIIAAGFDPLFVTDEQVAAGELEKKGVKALFLPMTLSLGRGDKAGGLAVAPAIEAFLDRGGLVVATHDFRYDEFLQRRDAPESITGRIVKLGEVKDDLAAAIGRSGAAPFATLRGPDGAAIPHASLFVHRLQGDVEAHIVTALRPPLGSKEVLGADGVIHSVPDDTGGSEVEPAALDLSGFGRVTAYDMRSGGVLKQTGGKVTFDMRAGDGFPVAVLPYTAKSLAVTAARRDRTLVVEWRLRGNARVYAPHVMHISTTDSRGAVVPALTLNAVTGPDGAGSVAIPLSWEEEFIALNVSVRDALTGLTGSAKP